MLNLGIGLWGGRQSSAAAPYPLDAFSGPAADCAWGTFAWVSSAVGQNALTTDDGTPANATMGADGFVSGTFTGQRVSKLFAQVGVSTLDQATLAKRPTIWQSAREAWPEIRLHNRYGTDGGKVFTVGSPPTARSGRSWTFVTIERGDPQTVSGGVGLDKVAGTVDGSMSGASAYGVITSSPNITTGSWAAINRLWPGTGSSIDSNTPHRPNLKFYVKALRMNATNIATFVDGVKTTTAGVATNTSVAPYKVGELNDFGLHSDCVSMLGCAWFPELSDAEIDELTDLIHARLYGVTPTSLWYFDGDSITGGYDASDSGRDIKEKSWPYLLLSSLSATQRAKITGVNYAWSGADLETAATGEFKLLTNQAGKVNAHIGSSTGYTNRVVVICAGTNDINAGTSGATTLAALQTYASAAITAGATRVLVCTQIPRQGFSGAQNTQLAALNSGILSTFGSDAIDIAAQNWQPGGASDWSTNYQDGIHPNAAGRQLIVDAISSTMTGLL